jgi:TPR repeat protein
MRQAVLLLAVSLLFVGCTAINKVFYDDDFVDGNNAFKRGDYATAAMHFKTACDERNDKYSCYNLGHIYYDNKDLPNAIIYFIKACDVRNPQGCGAIAYMYETGDGFEQNYSKSVPYYEQACGGGLYESCQRLADLYTNGLGVTKNLAQAQILREKSCTDNYNSGNACYDFGIGYIKNGDITNAKRILETGCEKRSDANSCRELGNLYMEEDKKERDEKYQGELKDAADKILTGDFSLREYYGLTDGGLEAIYMVGHEMYKHKQYDKAKGVFAILCTFDPLSTKYTSACGSAHLR